MVVNMCGLCAAYRREPHWSDPLTGEESRRDRYSKANFINQVTQIAGVKVRDFCGSSYTITNRKGKSLIAYTPEDLWDNIITLAECSLDPLGQDFIARSGQYDEH